VKFLANLGTIGAVCTIIEKVWPDIIKAVVVCFCPGGGIPGLGANVGRVLGGTAPNQKHTGCRGTSVAGKAQQAEFLRRR